MIQASKAFESLVHRGANVVNYADITFRDGTTLNLEPKDFMINGCTIDDSTSQGSVCVGNTIGKTIQITLANHEDQLSGYDFYKATFVLYCALKIGNEVEKVRKGTYYIIEPETPGEVIQFSGVDAMHFFDKPYDSALQFPTTLQNILSDACVRCGVEVGFGQFDRYNLQVSTKPTDCTYREVVGWVAQAAGYHARVNNLGALELVWYTAIEDRDDVNIDNGTFEDYEAHDYIVDGGNFIDYTADTIYDAGSFYDASKINILKSITVGTDPITVTGVKIVMDTEEFLAGTEDYCITIPYNPLLTGIESDTATYLLQKLADLPIRPLSVQIPCNPLYEPFDSVIVIDRKGTTYTTIINHISYRNGGYTLLECKADPPIRSESYYQSEAGKAVVRARRDTREALSEYDLDVQNMNQIAANALGYYTTYEDLPDGSRITYLHDKSTLETSTTIYKITADGFFVSTDGGESYTAGFDAQGNAVVNILSAIGIKFDWAKGGTLILGGDNNVNGEIQIMNADGVACGKINNNGISMYSPTSLVQVIITPEIGLVMRDADGNEFYGLTTRQNFSVTFAPSYRIYRTYSMLQNSITLHAVVVDKQTISGPIYNTYKYKFRYYWTCSPIWIAEDTVPSAVSSSVRTLPISFQNKNISVQITNNGMTQAIVAASTKNKVFNHYNSNVVKTKADGTQWTDTNWSSRDTMYGYNVGEEVSISTLNMLDPNFLPSCQYYSTANSYAGTNHALGSMPAQNDYLTDMNPAPSVTSDYTYEYDYVTDNTVPSVTVTAEATEHYTGMGTQFTLVGYVGTWSQGTKELDLPISDLLSLTMVATC